METKVSAHPFLWNGAGLVDRNGNQDSGLEQSVSESAVDECRQMTLNDDIGWNTTCHDNHIDLTATDRDLKKEPSVIDSSESNFKAEEFERIQDAEEEHMVLERNSPDRVSDTVLDLEQLEDNVTHSSQASLSASAYMVNEKADISNDTLMSFLRSSNGKKRKSGETLNDMPAVAGNQRPRSIRNGNGVKKSTWGTTEVLQMVSSKGVEEKSVRKSSDTQRGSRQARKRRHIDMVSDGDIEWEAVTGEVGSATGNSGTCLRAMQKKGAARSTVDLTLLTRGLSGDSAAVTVGLQAQAPGPAERIRFKDVLKRRGGVQEYIECRNSILGLWERDLCHILSIGDCGISVVAAKDESPRVTLLRDIYDFLNYHGYVNAGIATKKVKATTEVAKHVKKDVECQNLNIACSVVEINKPVVHREMSERESVLVSTKLEVESSDPGVLNGMKRVQSTNIVVASRREAENELMGIDEKPLNNAHVSKGPGELHVEAEMDKSSDHSADEESLLDIRNRIKAKNKKKKGLLQKLKPPSTKEESKVSTCGDMKTVELKDSSLVAEKKAIVKLLETDIGTAPNDLNLTPVKDEVEQGKIADPGSATAAVDESLNLDTKRQVSRKRVIIVGAGPAGLAAGRHLHNMDVDVTILEARERVGGRVFTDRSSFTGPVDLGASIITGVEADVASERRPDPSALLCKQLDLELTTLRGDCPLFDFVTGEKVPTDIDVALEAEYNSLLDDTVMLVAQNGDAAMQMSLEEGLELLLEKRRMQSDKGQFLSRGPGNLGNLEAQEDQESPAVKLGLSNSLQETTASLSLERRVMNWHFANLEYGCAAELKNVSLPYWNQDDVYGGFGGPHCMIKGGYSTVMEALGNGLNIQMGKEVVKVDYLSHSEWNGGEGIQVKVHTKNGDVYRGDAVLVTVPLGCLKADTIEFVPPLPDWKKDSIQRLGFGVLNKVVLEFPVPFWDENVDYFGATAEKTEMRGRCFMFWNLKRTVGAPVLIALVVGQAAIEEEGKEAAESVNHALTVLKKLFGEASVPQPTSFAVTKWGSDPFSRGAYSYVAVGASGEDYDILGRPVESSVFFAGEATCKEHPDTVGGAMMSGLREAVRITDTLYNRGDSMAEAEAMAASQRQSDSERNEVRDMTKRLTAAELSNAIWKDCGKAGGNEEPFNKATILQDMFGSAKTTSGRLLLAKEMLQLPASSLKAFAGTKEGLTVLNSWIQDSMGKDGTQLLRHCVRLLLVVGTDLSSVRQSGIGRTVKEKVVVHTSRDIRAVADQLVKLWVEAFRKEKAARHTVKSVRQTASHASTLPKLKTKQQKFHTKVGAKLMDSVNNLSSHAVPSMERHRSEDENKLLGSSDKDKSSVEGAPKESTIERRESRQMSEQARSISDIEASAIAAAKAAKAAAEAAAKALETAEAVKLTQPELPKILSFQRFAKREHMTMSDSNKRKSLEREMLLLHKDQYTSGIDARNCKVRDWSIDFSDSCSYLGSPSLLAIPDLGTSHDLMVPNLSGLATICTDMSGDYNPSSTQPERSWVEQDEAAPSSKEAADDASAGSSMKVPCDGKGPFVSGLASFNSGMMSLNSVPSVGNQKRDENFVDSSTHLSPDQRQSSNDFVTVTKPVNLGSSAHSTKGSEGMKKAVTEYVAQLLTPLYKTRRIDKENFKSIVKKTTVKVMERRTEQEAAMAVSEFLDTKRKVKIRSLVDKFVERCLESVR